MELDVVDWNEIVVYVYVVEIGLTILRIIIGVVDWDIGRVVRLR